MSFRDRYLILVCQSEGLEVQLALAGMHYIFF